jgi:glycosyltransferase involved in cell wall biosynthesis
MIFVKPRIAIDAVFFQLANSGIARVWQSLFREWADSEFGKHLLIIDRAGTAPKIPGLTYHQTPAFDFDNPALESVGIQAICDREQIDIFISTYHTIPLTTPSIVLVHDMLPEIFNTDLSVMSLAEKHWSILHAVHYICISTNTINDLRKFFPNISTARITLAPNGISREFLPQPSDIVRDFTHKYRIDRDFFLLVGNRYANGGFKNAVHFFRAFAGLPDRDKFSIVCVGGKPDLEPELVDLAGKTQVHILSLSDPELMAAYSGAVALIYPSLYEGFGLPILEAMACGCPVITCANSSIPEVAGDAVIYISGTNEDELKIALDTVRQPTIRSQLITAGIARTQQFSWQQMAEQISQLAIEIERQITAGELIPENRMWVELRMSQVGEYREGFYQLMRELDNARQQIRFMQDSKFWKLRQQWFKLKEIFRPFDDRIDPYR